MRVGILPAMFLAAATWAVPMYEAELIFDPDVDTSHGHAHASCVVECPNGDLLAVWYENAPELMPPPYYSDRKDKSDDVRIGGARKRTGQPAWDKPFVAADTFGVSDNNPCMVIDREQRLWLIHPALIGVPEETWGSALVRYHLSVDYEKAGPPIWRESNIFIPHPQGFEDVLANSFEKRARDEDWPEERRNELRTRIAERLKNVFSVRLGWMPRAHPLIRSDGALVLPLSNENFSIAAMAITKDGGATWTLSNPVPDMGLTQPTLVEFPDGVIRAFFRNGYPERRIQMSESADGGMTWSPVKATTLPHPGAGIEALLLDSGALAMVYNDKEDGRDSLAISLSSDRGETWTHTRHLENTPGGRFDYPSIIQAKDGSLHVTYTVGTRTIKHAHFNEDWIKAGDN